MVSNIELRAYLLELLTTHEANHHSISDGVPQSPALGRSTHEYPPLPHTISDQGKFEYRFRSKGKQRVPPRSR